MDPTTDDYQSGALFGPVANTSALDATMLNPAASGPGDWTTVLTNGISNATVSGINGMVNNAIQAGQLQNAITAKNNGLAVSSTGIHAGGGIGTLLLIGAVIYMLAH